MTADESCSVERHYMECTTARLGKALRSASQDVLLDRHHGLVDKELTRFHGHEVGTAGDGFFDTSFNMLVIVYNYPKRNAWRFW
jgi:hypothetical protein